jgi:hypothetical protein
MREMGYDSQVLVKEGQVIMIPIVAQHRPNHEVLGFIGQEASTISTHTTFIKVRQTKKEAIPMEEKEVEKGVCNKPLKSAWRGLEKGSKDMISSYISAPTLGGPSNQVGNHHHKPKRYGIVSLVSFYCKKRGHKDMNCWHFRKPRIPCRIYR